jgi:hypothetical protein
LKPYLSQLGESIFSASIVSKSVTEVLYVPREDPSVQCYLPQRMSRSIVFCHKAAAESSQPLRVSLPRPGF